MEFDTPLQFLSDPFLFLCACVAMNLFFSASGYPGHPVWLIDRAVAAFEELLHKMGWESPLAGALGSLLLFFLSAIMCLGTPIAIAFALALATPVLGLLFELYLGYGLLALGGIVSQEIRQNKGAAQDDLDLASRALAPLFYFALFGLSGLIVFRIVGAMEALGKSREGSSKRFGAFATRFQAVLDFLPNRITPILIAILAAVRITPGQSQDAAPTESAPSVARRIPLVYGVTGLFLILAACLRAAGGMWWRP